MCLDSLLSRRSDWLLFLPPARAPPTSVYVLPIRGRERGIGATSLTPFLWAVFTFNSVNIYLPTSYYVQGPVQMLGIPR